MESGESRGRLLGDQDTPLTAPAADAQMRPQVLYRAVLLAAGLVLLGTLFQQLATLLIAVLMTVIIAIPLSATADRLEKYRIPRPVGALMGLLAGVLVLAAVLALVIPSFIDQTKQFVDDVPSITDHVQRNIGDVTGERPGQVGRDVKDFLSRYTDHPERLVGPITSIGFNVAGIMAALVLMVLTAYYMAVRPEPLLNGVVSLFPPARRDEVRRVMGRLRQSWIGWMQGVAFDMLVSGVLLYIGLTIINVDLAIFFAVFSALLVVIPYFGSVIGAIPPTLFALADSPGKAALALGVYVLVQQIEGSLIIPLVMAQRVKLHPALIAIGVVMVGQLFGVIGLFVAVPILSMLVILIEELWVKPMEAALGVKAAGDLEVPSEGVVGGTGAAPEAASSLKPEADEGTPPA